MSQEQTRIADAAPAAPRPGQALHRRPVARKRRLGRIPIPVAVSVVILLVFVVTALIPTVLAPHDPLQVGLRHRLAPPLTSDQGDLFLLGTDTQGRDILSRIIIGSRYSILIGISAVAIGCLVGGLLGLIAGYFGKATDEAIMGVADIQLAFPVVLLAIAIVAVLGPSLTNLVIVLSISGWVTYARVIRGSVLGLKGQEFVEASRAIGGGHGHILFRHILPNVLSPVIVVATLDLARIIILESTLSFLGLGIQPPTPSWGSMLNEGREYQGSAWWIATFPGLAIMLTALSVNRIGDWLRDVLDPRLRT